ncbi:alpha/beta hydrolase [Nocardia yunnanensis]|uniref:Alpha/beta hydrolase n=1 Tax=Nocardia yunnanensis TaxID=2382165 RepID=A0A386Z580_9NOCA|nr:alpha/beta hydrolase [Nocardia yunnanensis]AYF72821.1 alpha/beta hydrolase [Nocardia yunnanensis]
MPSPQMREFIELFEQRRAARPATPPALADLRANFLPAGKRYDLPDDVRVSEVSAGGVPSHWLDAPGAAPERVLVFLHGGGFTLGSLASHGELAARAGRAAGVRVLFPEYRLSPEHVYPAALDDVRAIWRWLREDQGLPASSIALAGDSAGGNLLTALMLELRDAGADLPAAAVLISPVLDLTGSGASMTEREGQDPIFTPGMLKGIYAGYLGGADPLQPSASPLFGDPTALPPLLIQVGTAELILSDSERFADAARSAGVEVTLEAGEGLPHVYQAMRETPEAAAAVEQIAEFLRKHLV